MNAPDAGPRTIAIYGPTASGKSAVARALLDSLDGEVVSADSAALYAGLPILTAAPDYPARLVGVVPVTTDVSVGEYQRLAHAAIDEILAGGGTPVVAGGTGLYLRAALSALEIPPPPAPGERERWAAVYDADPGAAYELLAARDPDAAARVHTNDRRRVIRALELVEAGASLAPPEDRLWTDDMRHPTTLVGLELDLDELDRRIEVRVSAQVEAGVVAEAQTAWTNRSPRPHARCSASRRSRPCRSTRLSRRSSPRAADSPATSASGSDGSRSRLRSTPAAHRRSLRMRFERWQAQGNVYLVAEEPLTAETVRAEVGDTDGILEVTARGDDWLDIVIWNPDGSQAELSGNGTRIAARWLAEQTGARIVTVRVGPREVVAEMLGGELVEQDMGLVVVGEPEEVDGIRFTPVDVGNPHAVVEGDPAELPRIGPALETHPRFPNRTNVQVARRLGGEEIEARVHERGVGETGSSGTSAVAVAAALGVSPATVRFPGGELRVRIENGRAFLTGPAERVT